MEVVFDRVQPCDNLLFVSLGFHRGGGLYSHWESLIPALEVTSSVFTSVSSEMDSSMPDNLLSECHR